MEGRLCPYCYRLYGLLKKRTPYVSAIKIIFDMSAINIHCSLQIFHSIWNNISKVPLPSLPLLLFHFLWNHNSKGIVSPLWRPKDLWNIYIYISGLARPQGRPKKRKKLSQIPHKAPKPNVAARTLDYRNVCFFSC